MKLSAKTTAILVISGLVLSAGTQMVNAAPNAARTDYIVTFSPQADGNLEVSDARSKGLKVSKVFKKALAGMVVSLNSKELSELATRKNVVSIEADGQVSISDAQPNPTWGLDRIDQRTRTLNSSYSYPTSAGAGVTAYIIDTGILSGHSEFTGRVSAGWSAIGTSTSTEDCNGHGTHVAGTVAGTTYGVAKKATIVPVRVLDCSGSGSYSGVIAGIEWVIQNHVSGPAVANLSLGGGASTAIDDAINNLTADGVTVAVAAGNSATDACKSSPARAASALTVAATDSTDTQASFSNFGTCVDLYAPGVSITSAWYSGNSSAAALSGTSMASPHVAGVAAVILGQLPTLTPSQVSRLLLDNATTNAVQKVGTGTPNLLVYTSATPVSAPSTATAPSAPTSVVATAIRSQKANISWTQQSNGGSSLTSQTIYIYMGGSLVGTGTVSGTVASAQVSGLKSGKNYTFSVSATNSVGTSPLSNSSNSITAIR